MARRQRSWEGKKFTKTATNTGGTVKVRDFSKPKPKATPKPASKAAPKKKVSKSSTGGPARHRTAKNSTGGPARHKTTKSSTGGPARHKTAKSSTGGPARASSKKKTAKRRVPGGAIVQAIKNTFSGTGPTDPTKIMRGDRRRKKK